MSIDVRRVTKGFTGPLPGEEGDVEVQVSCWDYPVGVTIRAPKETGLMRLALETLERVVDMNFPPEEPDTGEGE